MATSYVHVTRLLKAVSSAESPKEPASKKLKRGHLEDIHEWCDDMRCAEQIVPLLKEMWRDRRIEFRIFGNSLTHGSAEDIIRNFRSVSVKYGKIFSVKNALGLAVTIRSVKGLGCIRFDVGKIMSGVHGVDALTEMIRSAREIERDLTLSKHTDVVLYGFGRIGRLLARMLLSKFSSNTGPLLRAIVVRKKKFDDLTKRAELLLHDSVHGEFTGHVSVDSSTNSIVANGCRVQLIYSDGPDQLDYTAYGISNAVVVDNTGIWRDARGLGLHLKSKGVSKVILTAPGKGVPNIVHGVNDTALKGDERIVSAASCSTNAAVPVLKVIHDTFGIESGHIETVHSFTNDQNIIDNLHKKPRRGRSAPVNIVLTSTGAGKAVAKCIPSLNGKLTASAIRVPTPDVSILVLNLRLKCDVTREMVNSALETASRSRYCDQIDFVTSDEATSSDFLGNSHASIVDGNNTIAKDRACVLYVWYDNEYGYSCQAFRLLRKLSAGDEPADFP